MKKDSRIYIAGHRGLVGSTLLKKLDSLGHTRLQHKTRKELDLRKERDVDYFFYWHKPEYVFVCAAKVGGIFVNNENPTEFLTENLEIQNNVLLSAAKYGVKKLVFLGSSCIYPRLAKQPIKESELLNGHLEETNEAYAVAKIAGITLCKSLNRQYGTNFVAVMPTNLYGPGDQFDLQKSHVLAAMVRKFYEAKRDGTDVELYGTGKPKREFLHVDDLVRGLLTTMDKFDNPGGFPIINIGYGTDLSIKNLAKIIAKISKFKGKILWKGGPDGTPRKLLDSSKIRSLGWEPKVSLEEGLKQTYEWYRENEE